MIRTYLGRERDIPGKMRQNNEILHYFEIDINLNFLEIKLILLLPYLELLIGNVNVIKVILRSY